jgi:NTP pyrophosphatase (non-canonical NTP hydrolase)
MSIAAYVLGRLDRTDKLLRKLKEFVMSDYQDQKDFIAAIDAKTTEIAGEVTRVATKVQEYLDRLANETLTAEQRAELAAATQQELADLGAVAEALKSVGTDPPVVE